jgi:hypothetical protein
MENFEASNQSSGEVGDILRTYAVHGIFQLSDVLSISLEVIFSKIHSYSV